MGPSALWDNNPIRSAHVESRAPWAILDEANAMKGAPEWSVTSKSPCPILVFIDSSSWNAVGSTSLHFQSQASALQSCLQL